MAQKLYTEEQVKGMIEKSRETGLTAEYLILTTESIELPSDGVIKSEAKTQMEEWSGSGCEEEIFAFIKGAKWMRDKILNK